MQLIAQITPEDIEIAESMSASGLPSAGWRQWAVRLLSMFVSLLFVTLVLLLSGGYFFGIPKPYDAVRWSLYATWILIPLSFLLAPLERNIHRRRRFGWNQQTVEFKILPTGLAVNGTHIRQEFLWEGIGTVQHDGRYIYVLHTPSDVTVVPARCFSKYAEFEEFFAKLLQHIERGA